MGKLKERLIHSVLKTHMKTPLQSEPAWVGQSGVFSYFSCVFSTFTPCLAQSILDVKLENAYNQTAKREKSRKRTM